MDKHGRRAWRTLWAAALLALMLVVAAVAAATLPVPAAAAPRNNCAGPVAGQYIYDCANLLTPSEVARLETDAAAVVHAGAPTVVYLQVRDATAQQTLQDAIDLMNRWNVESQPGAHDGFVMFFDLQPGNLRHGQVALYAGAKHYQHGNLPQSELDRIRTDVMSPLLSNGKTAEGIAAGLQMVAHDLQYGPPPPPAYQTVAANLGRIPYNVLAALFAGVVGLLFVRLSRRPPVGGETSVMSAVGLASPGDLPPAVAGALIRGRVGDQQIEATILDFARRGLLVIEPNGKDKVRMHLLRSDKEMSAYEKAIWDDLAARADEQQRTLSDKDLADLRAKWSWPKSLLRRDLTERGWYDPDAASARRRPLYIGGAVGMVGAAAALILLPLGQEAWAAIGLVIFFSAGLAAFIRAATVPDTTVEGEIAAAPWRGYQQSVEARAYEPNLDTDLPYIVALGLVGKLAPRLKAASERGYAPAWFRQAGGQEMEAGSAVGFYPYWVAFHSSMAPMASGSASGGYSGAGAAGGGGGSAGGF